MAKVAYIMSRFPHLPETFILREMNMMSKEGVEIVLFPLIKSHQSIVHAEAQHWIKKAHYTGFFSGPIIWAFFKLLITRPFTWMLILKKTIVENWPEMKYLLRSLVFLPKAVYLADVFNRLGVQHVHVHYATFPAYVAWVIHQLTGLSYSVTVHAHDIYVSQAMLTSKLGDAARVIAISKYNKRFLIERVAASLEHNIRVIHCGIEPAWYNREKRIDTSVSDLFSILSIGSLQPYKGQEYLIQACALLKNESIPFECKIVGSGKLESRLYELIEEYDLANEVVLLGSKTQSEVAELLLQTDCYVQPSIIDRTGKMEGIPLSLMEALASELPVVASDISGISELVSDGETGYNVSEKSPEELVKALVSIYRDPTEANRRAKQGKQLVLTEFHLIKNVKQLAAEFKMIISDRQ